MRLVSWNINGIRAVQRKGLFDPVIEELAPDVICLQEVKAEQHESTHQVEGYEEFWHPAKKKGYSGTAVFTRPTALKVTTGLPSMTPAEAVQAGATRGALGRCSRGRGLQAGRLYRPRSNSWGRVG